MSNFSQFFPAGGGSGGSGGGINSYAPFLVTSTSGNPVGYDVTTGIYTNPVDSSVWLKTGTQAILPKDDYPNAANTLEGFGTPSALFDYTTSTNFSHRIASCQAINGTDFVFFGRKAYPSHEIQAVTPSGVATGPTGVTTAPAGSPRGLVTDGTNYFMITEGNAGSTCYVFSGTTMQQTSTFSVGFNADGIAFDSSTGNLVFTDSASKRELTTSGTLVSSSTGANVNAKWAYDSVSGRFLYLDSSTLRWVTSDTSTFDGAGFPWWVSQPSPYRTTLCGHLYNGTLFISTGQDTKLYQSLSAVTLGDPTARTSAMGDGQPLFIKLK
jgi:hypothetical protein